MSPLHCNTVREALWERVASSGPEPLTPALAEHLASCSACQSERRAVRDLVEVSRAIVDPTPPADIWDGFDEELERRLDDEQESPLPLPGWGRKVMGLAAMLVVGFGLGVVAMRSTERVQPTQAAAERDQLLAEIQAELSNDARLDTYLTEIEELLVAYHASEQGEAVRTFRESLPRTLVAGPGVPSESDRLRLEAQRATREQLRTVVIGMLTSEIESERRGFGYLNRRIAEIAGQRLLYFVH